MTTAVDRQADIGYLVAYGREDWIGMSVISSTASHWAFADLDATFDDEIAEVAALAGILIDNGIVPGDLVAEDPGFAPWPGTRDELVERLVNDIRALGDLPESGQIAWFHQPDHG